MLYEPKFYKCGVCDAILESITPHCCDDLTCCGKPMELLKANELIALEEKHLPIVKREGNNLTVCVGRVLHPMSKEHSIQWIEVKSKYLEQRITLKKGDDPIATFEVPENVPVTVYSYCNLHGLGNICRRMLHYDYKQCLKRLHFIYNIQKRLIYQNFYCIIML